MKSFHPVSLRFLAGVLWLLIKGTIPCAAEPVTFAEHVAPILYENCVTCHNPNGIGPFNLIEYEQVKRRARQINEVTQSGYMPPWKPDSTKGPKFIGERHLSESQISILSDWAESGAPSGDLSQAPKPPDFESGWTLGEPDLVLELDEAFTLRPEGEDIYQNFVLPNPVKERVYVNGFELLPGTRLAIHHAILTVDQTGEARKRDAAQAGPGWESMEIGGQPPAGHIIGWTPGQAPYQSHPGTAWEVEPNSDLVLQLHLLPTGREEPIRPKIGLYLTEQVPHLKSYVFQLRNYNLDIPPGETNYFVEASLEIPVPVKIVGLYPHAHYLGKNIRLLATFPDGTDFNLIHIPNWDFNWQGDYRIETPIDLPAHTVLKMAYTYDNSESNPFNPTIPPVRVTGGWRSLDEMAEAMFQVVPENPEDVALLAKTQLEYDFQLAGGEAKYHYYQGILYEENRKFGQAMAAYQSALRADPDFASAFCRVGIILDRNGDLENATLYFERALALEPNLTAAKVGLAKVYYKTGQRITANFMLDEVLSNHPENLEATIWQSRYLNATGQSDAANALLENGAIHFNGNPEYHMEFGASLLKSGRSADAESHLETVVETVDDSNSTAKSKAIAFYFLASIHRQTGRLDTAASHARNALQRDPDYLEALLLTAQIAIEASDASAAKNALEQLISKPETETFPYQDIVDNLPLPKGALLLANAYQDIGKTETARNVLNRAIERSEESTSTEMLQTALFQLELP